MDTKGDTMNIPFVIDYLKWLLICLSLYWSIEDQYINQQMTLKKERSIYPKRPYNK